MNINKIREETIKMEKQLLTLYWTMSDTVNRCNIILENELQEDERHDMQIKINHLVYEIAHKLNDILSDSKNLITDMK